MLFEADSYFHIGRAHLNGGKPCQDYALAGTRYGAVYGIVADGCSTGGKTDVGARILALATAQALMPNLMQVREIPGDAPTEIALSQRITLAGVQEILGLSREDMLATCVYFLITPWGGYIHLQGDGVVALKERDGTIHVRRYEWKDNKPLYPAYAKDRFAGFLQEHGGDLTALRLLEETWEYIPARGFLHREDKGISLEEGIRGIILPISLEELTSLDCVAIFTDGVAQVDGMDWKQAVVDCLAFRAGRGEFAKRRVARFIKEAQEIGKGPMDDLACAVTRIILPEEVK